jgi:hypothetical protein
MGMDEKDFTIGLDFDEACVLLRIMEKALPKLPEDDGWLIFQLVEKVQVLVDNYGKESA